MINERIIFLVLACLIGLICSFFTYKQRFLPKMVNKNVLYWCLLCCCLLAIFLNTDKEIRNYLKMALIGIILGSLLEEIWQKKKM